MFFPIFSNVFTNILKIYELPKIYNKILKKLFTIITYQVKSMSQLHLSSELYWKCTLAGKRLLSLSSTVNLVYVLEINIFGRDGIIQIWIISSKDINIQYLCKIYCRELGQYLMQFDALEKNVVRLQITVFKNCNKWRSVYKDCSR